MHVSVLCDEIRRIGIEGVEVLLGEMRSGIYGACEHFGQRERKHCRIFGQLLPHNLRDACKLGSS